jgi:hypothetical protein
MTWHYTIREFINIKSWSCNLPRERGIIYHMTNVTFDEGEDFGALRRSRSVSDDSSLVVSFFIRHSFGIINTRSGVNALLILIAILCAVGSYFLLRGDSIEDVPAPLTPLVNNFS